MIKVHINRERERVKLKEKEEKTLFLVRDKKHHKGMSESECVLVNNRLPVPRP